jgi:hypothetical protein
MKKFGTKAKLYPPVLKAENVCPKLHYYSFEMVKEL